MAKIGNCEKELMEWADANYYAIVAKDVWRDAKQALENQKECEWIITGSETGALGISYSEKKCSNCGWSHSLLIPDKYCPECGAKNVKRGKDFYTKI